MSIKWRMGILPPNMSASDIDAFEAEVLKGDCTTFIFNGYQIMLFYISKDEVYGVWK